MSTAIRDVPRVVDSLVEDFTARNGGDDTDTRPAWKREPDEPIVDLDKPGYDRADPRSRLLNPDDATAAPTDKAPPEILPPRSWSKEEQRVFSALDPETQARIAERESRREAYFSEKQSQLDKERHATQTELRQQYEADLRTAAQAKQAALEEHARTVQEVQASHALQAGLQAFQTKYGIADITAEQLQQINETNPELAQQILKDAQDLHTTAAQVKEHAERREFKAAQAQVEQQRQAERQRAEQAQVHSKQLADWQAQQDAAFTKANPDFAHEAKAKQIRETVVIPYLQKQLGLSPERVSQLWHNEPVFRTAEAQQMLLDAAQWRAAQERARNSRPVAAPRPQRPGLSNGTGGTASELQSMSERGDMQAYVAARRSGKVR